MATPSPARPDGGQLSKNQGAEREAAAVAAFVVRTLGRPEDFLRVTVVRLWANRFRVNVLAGCDAITSRIAHSYFVSTDEGGRVAESVPPITRLY